MMTGTLFADGDGGASPIYLAIAVGAAGVATAVFTVARQYVIKWGELATKKMIARQRKQARDGQQEAFIRFAKFHQQLERVQSLGNVERMLLFVGENGGGLPDLTKPYTVTAQHGWAVEGKKNPQDDYNFRLVVDKGYCLMLAEMIRDGRVIQTTATMSEMILKKYYKIEGVVQALNYLLNISAEENRIMFLSVASYTRDFTPDELAFIDVRVDRMRAIVSESGDGAALHPAIDTN